jgi:hemerythrin
VFLEILQVARGEFESTMLPKHVLERLHETMIWWINDHILKVDIKLKDSVGASHSGRTTTAKQ